MRIGKPSLLFHQPAHHHDRHRKPHAAPKSHREFNVTRRPAGGLLSQGRGRALGRRSGHDRDLILGCGNPTVWGRNLGRQAVLRAELPLSSPAPPSRHCASGLQAIAIAAGRSVVAEGVDAMIAGGVETISGLRPADNNPPTDMDPWLVERKPALFMAMIDTADIVAKRYAISREIRMRLRCKASSAPPPPGCRPVQGRDHPLAPRMAENKGHRRVTRRDVVPHDNTTAPRPARRPGQAGAGQGAGSFITAGNASQLSDGSSSCVVGPAKPSAWACRPWARCAALPWPGASRMKWASAGVRRAQAAQAPWSDRGRHRPVGAERGLCLAGLYCQRQLGIPNERLNVNGGAMLHRALFGATGCAWPAVILEGQRRKADPSVKWGVVTMCIGGGQGAAGLFEIF